MIAGKTAVLCIDLQNEYRVGAAWPVLGFDSVLANAAQLIAAARENALPVIHLQAWVEEAARQSYARLEDCTNDETRSAVAGSDGADICAEVTPMAGDVVVRKQWPSGFMGTDLEAILKARGVKDIVVTGVVTDSCVQGTVCDAVYRGFRVWLVKDACSSLSRLMHRTAVLDMANRLYGGGVLVTNEGVKALGGQPHRAWRCTRPVEFAYEADTLDAFYEAL